MMYEARDWTSPLEMARHLSRSITDPSAIRAHTANYFGKARAISDRQAVELVQAERAKRDRAKGIAEHNNRVSVDADGVDFRPRAIANTKAISTRTISIKPVARPSKEIWPNWYKPRAHRLPPQEVVLAVGKKCGFTYAEMTGDSRALALVAARAIAAKVLVGRGMSLNQVAKFLNRKDHSTIANLLAKFDRYCADDPKVWSIYSRFAANEGRVA